MTSSLLSLEHVRKGYAASADAPETPVLRDVNFSLQAGEACAIVGQSGSGKSTLLNIIGTLDMPDSGCVLLNGSDLAAKSEKELTQIRAKEIGLIFQLHHLLPQCTVLENTLVPTIASVGRPVGESYEARARRLLDRVGLGHRLNHRPGQLSGGERQRVAVVRALINRPSLLLADEPTGALDRVAADSLAELLLELNREENVALLVITHDPTLAARMGRVLLLRDGTLNPMAA